MTCISEGRHGFVGTPSSCRRISRQRRFLHCQSSCNVDAHNSVNKTSRKGTECGNNSVLRFGQKSLWKFPRLVANTTAAVQPGKKKMQEEFPQKLTDQASDRALYYKTLRFWSSYFISNDSWLRQTTLSPLIWLREVAKLSTLCADLIFSCILWNGREKSWRVHPHRDRNLATLWCTVYKSQCC